MCLPFAFGFHCFVGFVHTLPHVVLGDRYMPQRVSHIAPTFLGNSPTPVLPTPVLGGPEPRPPGPGHPGTQGLGTRAPGPGPGPRAPAPGERGRDPGTPEVYLALHCGPT